MALHRFLFSTKAHQWRNYFPRDLFTAGKEGCFEAQTSSSSNRKFLDRPCLRSVRRLLTGFHERMLRYCSLEASSSSSSVDRGFLVATKTNCHGLYRLFTDRAFSLSRELFQRLSSALFFGGNSFRNEIQKLKIQVGKVDILCYPK